MGFSHSINCNLAILKKSQFKIFKISTCPGFTLYLFLIFKFVHFFNFTCVFVFCVLFMCGKHLCNTFLCAS